MGSAAGIGAACSDVGFAVAFGADFRAAPRASCGSTLTGRTERSIVRVTEKLSVALNVQERRSLAARYTGGGTENAARPHPASQGAEGPTCPQPICCGLKALRLASCSRAPILSAAVV